MLAITAAAACIQLILLGTMGLSVTLLSEESRRIAGEIREISVELDQFQSRTESAPEVDLLRARIDRIEWSPKLALLGDLDRVLVLVELEAESPGGGLPPALTLKGMRTDSGSDFTPISRWLECLRATPTMTDELPAIMLDRLEDEPTGRFTIVCRGRMEVQ